jgi:hypothetical protein
VTGVLAPTADVVTANVALAAPAATVTLAGAFATAVLLLESATTAPPAGAPEVNVTVPVAPLPPVTLDGLTETADSDAGVVEPCGVKRRVDENGPNTPAAFRARTRHHSCCAGRPLSVACETVTVGFAIKGAEIVDELSTWTS